MPEQLSEQSRRTLFRTYWAFSTVSHKEPGAGELIALGLARDRGGWLSLTDAGRRAAEVLTDRDFPPDSGAGPAAEAATKNGGGRNGASSL